MLSKNLFGFIINDRDTLGIMGYSVEEWIFFLTFILVILTSELIRREIVKKREESKLLKEFTDIWDIETVLKKGVKTENATFFRPNGPIWVDFKFGYVFERTETNEIIEIVKSNRKRFIVVEGEKAVGKTVCAQTVAYKLATSNRGLSFQRNYKVFILRDATTLRSNRIPEIVRNFKKNFDNRHTLLVIDECHFNPDGCEEIANQIATQTKHLKVLFVTRLSYERAVELEPNRSSWVYDLSEGAIKRLSSEDVTQHIIYWFAYRFFDLTLKAEIMQILIDISGYDLIYLGRIILAWRDLVINLPVDALITERMVKEQVYNKTSKDLTLLRKAHPDAVRTYLIICLFYMYQLKVEKNFLIQRLQVVAECITKLETRGEIHLSSLDGKVSMGHPSEAKLLVEAADATSLEEFNILKSLFNDPSSDLISLYLSYKAGVTKDIQLQTNLFEKEELRENIVRLSYGGKDERKLLIMLLRTHFESVKNYLAEEPNDLLMWARAARQVGCIEQAKELKKKGTELLNINPDLAGEEGWFRAAKIHRDFGEDQEALRLFQKTIELQPQFLKARDVYANFLKSKGLYSEAQEQYQKILDCNPDSISLSNIARFYSERGNPNTANALFQKAINKNKIELISEEMRIGVYQGYARFLYLSGQFSDAENNFSIAKKIALKTHRNTARILCFEAELYVKEAKYEKAEECYIEALNSQREMVDRTESNYARFLLDYGTKIQTKDGRPKYSYIDCQKKSIELLENWLSHRNESNRHPIVLAVHRQLGTILYTKVKPPNFQRAEDELRKAYMHGTGSGNLHDAITDLALGKLMVKKYELSGKTDQKLLEQVEHFLKESYNAVKIENILVMQDHLRHLITAGIALAEFLSKYEKDFYSPGIIFSNLLSIIDSYKQFDLYDSLPVLLNSYGRFEEENYNFEGAKKYYERALAIEGDSLVTLKNYAILLQKVARRTNQTVDFLFTLEQYWKMLDHKDLRRRISQKTVRNQTDIFEIACAGISTLIRTKPFYKPWSAIKILNFAFQKNKKNLVIAKNLIDILSKQIVAKIDEKKVNELVAKFPTDPFCWCLKGMFLKRERKSKEMINQSYSCAYELFGTDSCRTDLFKSKVFVN